jgi:hypothetical protein
MSGLCVLAAGVLMNWSASTFTLSWTHSVEKTAWQESWMIEGDALILQQARVKGSGAGMDPGEGARLLDGWWVWQPSLPPVPSLMLSASGATISPWTLCVLGECMSLGEFAQEPVKLWSCDVSTAAAVTRTAVD